MLKIVLIFALVAIAPSEAHLKKLLLKKGIAKHLLPSALTEKLPPVKNILPFFGGGLGAILGGGAGGGGAVADVAEAAVGEIGNVNVESSEGATVENNVEDVADPPQSSKVPVMPLEIPSECTADKPCRFYYVPVYVLYPYYDGYYYLYPNYSYYPYYPYPYPNFYASSEHRSTSPAPSETSW